MRVHTKIAMQSLLTISLWTAPCGYAGERTVDPGIEETEINGTLIPKEMYLAYRDLDHMLSPGIKKEIAEGSEEALAKYYMELAGWIRNNWISRRDSALRLWFRTRGIDDPEDIPDIILRSYRRYLRDEPLGLDPLGGR